MNPHLLIPAALTCGSLLSPSVLADGSDNFNDNSRNTTLWGTDVAPQNGVLTETGQRLQFTCAATSGVDETARPWILTRLPYNADWDMQIDAFNTTSPIAPFQVNSMGITLESPLSGDTFLYHELYNSALGGPPARTGFSAQMDVGGTSVGGGDSGGPQGNSGAVRLRWDAASQTVTAYYDLDPSDGYQWIDLGTFGLGAGAAAPWPTAIGAWRRPTGSSFPCTAIAPP